MAWLKVWSRLLESSIIQLKSKSNSNARRRYNVPRLGRVVPLKVRSNLGLKKALFSLRQCPHFGQRLWFMISAWKVIPINYHWLLSFKWSTYRRKKSKSGSKFSFNSKWRLITSRFSFLSSTSKQLRALMLLSPLVLCSNLTIRPRTSQFCFGIFQVSLLLEMILWNCMDQSSSNNVTPLRSVNLTQNMMKFYLNPFASSHSNHLKSWTLSRQRTSNFSIKNLWTFRRALPNSNRSSHWYLNRLKPLKVTLIMKRK